MMGPFLHRSLHIPVSVLTGEPLGQLEKKQSDNGKASLTGCSSQPLTQGFKKALETPASHQLLPGHTGSFPLCIVLGLCTAFTAGPP